MGSKQYRIRQTNVSLHGKWYDIGRTGQYWENWLCFGFRNEYCICSLLNQYYAIKCQIWQFFGDFIKYLMFCYENICIIIRNFKISSALVCDASAIMHHLGNWETLFAAVYSRTYTLPSPKYRYALPETVQTNSLV